MNSVNLIGRLTKDPVLRYTQNQVAVLNFTIAIDRPPRQGEEKQADFPNVVVFGRSAENCNKYLEKGRLVGVTGEIRTGKYQNKRGETVWTLDVVASRVQFLEWKRRDGYQGGTQQGAYSQQNQKAASSGQQNQQNQQPNYADDIPGEFEQVEDDVPF